jgi:hypothetical protein
MKDVHNVYGDGIAVSSGMFQLPLGAPLNYLHLIRAEIHEWSLSLPLFTPSLHAVYIIPYTEVYKSQFTPQKTCIYKDSTVGVYELYFCVNDFWRTRQTLPIR